MKIKYTSETGFFREESLNGYLFNALEQDGPSGVFKRAEALAVILEKLIEAGMLSIDEIEYFTNQFGNYDIQIVGDDGCTD